MYLGKKLNLDSVLHLHLYIYWTCFRLTEISSSFSAADSLSLTWSGVGYFGPICDNLTYTKHSTS